MKNHLKFSMVLVVFCNLWLGACKKEKIDDDPSTTAGTKVPTGTQVWFRFKVGGTQTEATTLQVFQSNGGGTATTLWRYTLNAELGSGKTFSIQAQNLQGQKVAAQTFDLSVPSSQNNASVQYNDGSTTWLSGSGSAPGTWTISKIEGSNTAGSFEFRLRSASSVSDSIMVTEGSYSTNNYGEI
jgi:hypothetical protein